MRFENLDIWKRSSRLCVDIYKELAHCKDYGFKDQITRCSLSVPSNIAEGFERDTDKDGNKFCNYSAYFVESSCSHALRGNEVFFLQLR